MSLYDERGVHIDLTEQVALDALHERNELREAGDQLAHAVLKPTSWRVMASFARNWEALRRREARPLPADPEEKAA